MKSFIARHAEKITAVLSGFDRLVFRGTIRRLAYLEGFRSFLWRRQVLLKDFADYVQRTTQRLKLHTLNIATCQNRPHAYLPSAATSKEDVARRLLDEHPIRDGLICILSCVEPCSTFEVHRSRERKRLELQRRFGQCLHYYHYFLDPRLGFCSARIQTWFPFSVQICLNGREWLARQMDLLDIGYRRAENCFRWLQDPRAAQSLMDRQLRASWPKILDGLVGEIFPHQDQLLGEPDLVHYWSVHQSEWATDLLFESSHALAAIYPDLVLHGITHFASPDVMRFLGQKVHGAFRGEIVSDFKDRPEGVRVKHRAQANSIKIYDKQGSVLRVETTINDPRDFKVWRTSEGDSAGKKDWRSMRKGIADLHRRAEVSQASNKRYLDALAAVESSTPLGELVTDIQIPKKLGTTRVRGLRPLDPVDLALFQAVNRGEFSINGFRNRDIAQLLYPNLPNSVAAARSRTAKVTRLFRILRAHGLIRKVPRTHRYQVTDNGRRVINALLTARRTPVNQLEKMTA